MTHTAATPMAMVTQVLPLSPIGMAFKTSLHPFLPITFATIGVTSYMRSILDELENGAFINLKIIKRHKTASLVRAGVKGYSSWG